MSIKLSRNFNTIVWKYIYWFKINKYVYYLKSRIYKALIQKSYRKAHYLQIRLISSPLVKIFALKQNVLVDNFNIFSRITRNWRNFHIGYVIKYIDFDYILNLNILIETESRSFAVYSDKLLEVINCIRELLVGWVLSIYLQNFYDTVGKNYFRLRNFENDLIANFVHLGYQMNLYSIAINFDSIFCFLSPDFLLSKLNLIRSLNAFLKEYLLKSKLASLIKSLDSIWYKYDRDYLNPKFYLVNLLIEFILIVILNEVKSMSQWELCNDKQLCTVDFCILSNKFDLLIFSKKYKVLKIWQSFYYKWLVSNGIQVKPSLNQKISFLSEGNYLGIYFVFYGSYKLCNGLSIKPSLYSQFCFLKKVSLIIKQLKSKSVFLLIIQLNKLFLSYSQIFFKAITQKVFSFLDYLVYLKLKAYLVNMHSNWSYCKIAAKYFSFNDYRFNHKVRLSNWVMSTLVKDLNSYKFYFLIKLSWF